MKLPKYEIEVTRPKAEGKTLAYVRIQLGPLWVTCRLDRSNGRYFLNPPANFVQSLQGRPTASGGQHSGWINTAGFTPEFSGDVKHKALAELGLKGEEVTA